MDGSVIELIRERGEWAEALETNGREAIARTVRKVTNGVPCMVFRFRRRSILISMHRT